MKETIRLIYGGLPLPLSILYMALSLPVLVFVFLIVGSGRGGLTGGSAAKPGTAAMILLHAGILFYSAFGWYELWNVYTGDFFR